MSSISFLSCIKLHTAVQYSLAHHLYPNAIFLAERLLSQAKQHNIVEPANILLASCYFNAGNVVVAHSLLQNTKSLSARYLYAKCCLDLGFWAEGEKALTEERNLQADQETLKLVDEPDEAAVHYLLGELQRCAGRHPQAILSYKAALNLNPFLWCAYQSICQLGGIAVASHFFTPTTAEKALSRMTSISRLSTALVEITNTTSDSTTNSNLPLSPPAKSDSKTSTKSDRVISLQQTPGNMFGSSDEVKESSFLSKLSNVTPSPLIAQKRDITDLAASSTLSFDVPSVQLQKPKPIAAQPKAKRQRMLTADGSSLDSPKRLTRSSVDFSSLTSRETLDLPTENSFKQPNNSNIDSLLMPPPQFLPTRPFNSISLQMHSSLESNNDTLKHHNQQDSQHKAIQYLMRLLQLLGEATALQNRYYSTEAITKYQSLGPGHSSSGWVQTQIAICHIQRAEFSQAAKQFASVREMDKWRIEGTDTYSGVLWSMNDPVRLSYLAHELVEFDKKAPQTWVSIGNLMAAQNDHDAAIKCFRRAIDLRPQYAYGRTCLGYEFIDKNDLDNALHMFRTALKIDPRHFNAWYGLGKAFFKQEKFDLALYHYRKAFELNPFNIILIKDMANVLLTVQKPLDALKICEKGLRIRSDVPEVKITKMRALVALEKYEDALQTGQELVDYSHTSATTTSSFADVLYLLGSIHKHLGHHKDALKRYIWSLDLSSGKNVAIVEDAIERLHEQVGEEEEKDLLKRLSEGLASN